MGEDVCRRHIQAVFIAIASSTDNFLVGLSVGLTRKPLPLHVLWGIAFCNATGCFIATSSGEFGGNLVNDQAGNVLACFAFTYLAAKEYLEAQDTEQQIPKQASLALALPMTINNLAGGITAGLLGIPAFWNFVYALSVSVLTMWIGYGLGKKFLSVSRKNHLLTYAPVLIYLSLSGHCLAEAFL
jgi:putative Mn2+ efflux pump MntP